MVVKIGIYYDWKIPPSLKNTHYDKYVEGNLSKSDLLENVSKISNI